MAKFEQRRYNIAVAMPQSGNGKGVSGLDSFLLAVAAGVVGSIIAHYICRALERHFGNNEH